MNICPVSPPRPDGAEAGSAAGLSVENSYEDFISGKKKSKSDGGKKRKGPPKSKKWRQHDKCDKNHLCKSYLC